MGELIFRLVRWLDKVLQCDTITVDSTVSVSSPSKPHWTLECWNMPHPLTNRGPSIGVYLTH
eukprot:5987714-Pyramimonas_sp.AAC.2